MRLTDDQDNTYIEDRRAETEGGGGGGFGFGGGGIPIPVGRMGLGGTVLLLILSLVFGRNFVGGGGPAVDDQPGGTGLPWATPGLVDLNGWLGPNAMATSVAGEGTSAPAAVDGSDWSYWETLVEQIRGGPTS